MNDTEPKISHTAAPSPRSGQVFLASVLGITVLTALLHVVGARQLRTSFWGVHFYAFFPSYWLVGSTVVLMGGALATAIKPAAVAAHLARIVARVFSTRTRAIVTGSVGYVAVVAVLWIARTRNTYLGDGNVLVASLPEGQAFHVRQPLTMWVQQAIYRAATPIFAGGERSSGLVAQDAVALGSVLAGAVFILVVAYLARELVILSGARLRYHHATVVLVALVLLSQGYVLLFFGYVENYSFYTVALAGYVWLSLRYLRGAAPLILPATAALLALALHLSAAILLPSFLALVGWGLFARRRPATIRDVAIAGVLFFALRYGLGMLSPGYDVLKTLAEVTGLAVAGDSGQNSGYMFSPRHLRDFLNEQLLIGPLGLFLFIPAGIAALSVRPGRLPAKITEIIDRNPAGIFLGVGGGAYLAAAWVAGDSNLGYARNWDLLAPGGLMLTVAALGLWLSAGRRPGRPGGAKLMAPEMETERRFDYKTHLSRYYTAAIFCALMLSLYHTVPWIATNASAGRSLERLKNLPLGLGRTEVLVGSWFTRRGEAEQARAWFEKAIAVNPRNNNAFYLLGRNYFATGDMSRAADALERAAGLRPDKVLFREQLIHAFFGAGRYAEALPHVEFMLDRRADDAKQWILYGEALKAAGRAADATVAVGKAIPLYESVWRLDPGGFESNVVYGQLFYNTGAFDTALEYFERALAAQPDSDGALAYAGYALHHLGRLEEANGYFSRCLEINPQHPDRGEISAWLRE